MRASLIPTRRSIAALAVLSIGSAVALLAGAPLGLTAEVAAGLLVLATLAACIDLVHGLRTWRAAPLQVRRVLPHALALGVPRSVQLQLANDGPHTWRVAVFDEVDAKLSFDGLPQVVTVSAAQQAELRFRITPRRRGPVTFGATQLRLRTRWGCFELLRDVGDARTVQVYPNFAAVARYAWLAGDRRLSQIGIKSFAQRGMGTDFKQLSDYQRGDPIRHIDWKASFRHSRPIVRQYQDERDQRVMFLLDCGRRMRADEGEFSAEGSHFDQALNALMLLSHVALKEGDEVGALSFGTPPGEQRHFAPRKGGATLNALMARLHDIEPGTTHSDYLLAAQSLMRLQPKRALVIVLTNFRDEDTAELQPALKLMRGRHLVMVASLRERVLREMAEQPIAQPRHALEVATAHWFEQSRREAFQRAVGRDALSIDAEPAQLAVALVNRYHAVKRAGLL
jgi:uncharacterized protein (DUF58 family)